MNFENRGGDGKEFPKPREGNHQAIIRDVIYLGQNNPSKGQANDRGYLRDVVLVVMQLGEPQPDIMPDGSPNESARQPFFMCDMITVSHSPNSATKKPSIFMQYHQYSTGEKVMQDGKAVLGIEKIIDTDKWIGKQIGTIVKHTEKGRAVRDSIYADKSQPLPVFGKIPEWVYASTIKKLQEHMDAPVPVNNPYPPRQNNQDGSPYGHQQQGQYGQSPSQMPDYENKNNQKYGKHDDEYAPF